VNLSTFEVFKVGVGPSSSHTMGPMLAARFFVLDLAAKGLLEKTAEIFVQLYGSLALTGLAKIAFDDPSWRSNPRMPLVSELIALFWSAYRGRGPARAGGQSEKAKAMKGAGV